MQLTNGKQLNLCTLKEIADEIKNLQDTSSFLELKRKIAKQEEEIEHLKWKCDYLVKENQDLRNKKDRIRDFDKMVKESSKFFESISHYLNLEDL